MKKTILTGLLVSALVLGIGGFAANAFAANIIDNRPNVPVQGFNVVEMDNFMGQQGIDVNEMYNYMNSGTGMTEMWEYMNENVDFEQMGQFMNDQNINFGQMQQYMQEIYPELDTQDFQNFYQGMHGTQGSSNSNFFGGMMN